jgi:signal transduction histidine kinase
MTLVWMFVGFFVLCLVITMAVTVPTEARVRKLSQQTRSSARHDYTEIVAVSGKDEVGAMAALFNDTAADIRRKAIESRDREEALRRYVENTTIDVGEPLVALEQRLGRVLAARPDDEMAATLRETHRLGMQVQNLAAVTRLRGITEATPREVVDLAGVVARLVRDREPLAASVGVTVDVSKATEPATVDADVKLIEQAIANVLDNAIIYNKPSGVVRIELHAYDHGRRFKLIVADTGPGVTDDEFAGLTANKRFRGDESRTRRPGSRGLGLALAREVADRFGLQLDIRRPNTGGLEVEIATRSR